MEQELFNPALNTIFFLLETFPTAFFNTDGFIIDLASFGFTTFILEKNNATGTMNHRYADQQ